MRNLIQYPITGDEVIKVVQSIPPQVNVIGGVAPVIKSELLKYLSRPEVMSDLLSHLRF